MIRVNRGGDAALEFNKIIDHSGVVVNEPIGALAYLGLARAHQIRGDLSQSRAQYEAFCSAWSKADLDIPVLEQARTEYARLIQRSMSRQSIQRSK